MPEHRERKLVHMCSPCTVFSKLMTFNRNKAAPDVCKAKYEKGPALLNSACTTPSASSPRMGGGEFTDCTHVTDLILAM